MSIDKAKLRAFAERLVSEHQAGKGDPVPAIGVPAADVLALLAEIERLSQSPYRQIVQGFASAAACAIAKDAKGCLEKGLLDQIEQLKTENRTLRTDNEAWRLTGEAERKIKDATVFGLSGEIDRMGGAGFANEQAALRKDAERYRWLRDGCGVVEYKAIAGSIGPGMLPSGDKLQAAIDAAMAREAPHG